VSKFNTGSLPLRGILLLEYQDTRILENKSIT